MNLARRLASSGAPVVAVLGLAGLVGGVLVGQDGLQTVVGCGLVSDAYASRTAADWKANADHVVVAAPTSERETNREDMGEGALEYTVDRSVALRAEEVLWSAERPRQTLAEEFEMTAPGWSVYRSGTRIKKTAPSASRLETGHTYILALRWSEGQWVVLGQGAAVPFDDQVVGRGEWCGRVLSEEEVAAGERFSRKSNNSLEKTAWGQGKQVVVRELEKADAPKRQ
ncbi:hypothetical protein ACFUIW_12315 [Streptomyces sp. NPDC057245]|uniref:hypothetical protein n=1 Tax=Streptomyces TaxID=1883 RepID=UPI0020A64987|nr:hypothetical protein [Streptomyces sp. A108]